jgi:hypothetical protein
MKSNFFAYVQGSSTSSIWNVRWDKARLDWAQVDAQNTCFRVLICKINCPYTGSCADVENSVDFLRQGRGLELATQCQALFMALELEAITLRLVVWEGVRAVLKVPLFRL